MFKRTRAAIGMAAAMLLGSKTKAAAPETATVEEVKGIPAQPEVRRLRPYQRVGYEHATYNGGKHRRRVDRATMQTYVDEAKARRERKAQKRFFEYAAATVNNACFKG